MRQNFGQAQGILWMAVLLAATVSKTTKAFFNSQGCNKQSSLRSKLGTRQQNGQFARLRQELQTIPCAFRQDNHFTSIDSRFRCISPIGERTLTFCSAFGPKRRQRRRSHGLPKTMHVVQRENAESGDLLDSVIEAEHETFTKLPFLSIEELQDFAIREYNTNLTVSTLGPGYRVVARSLDNREGYYSSEKDEGRIYGFCSGFIRPSGDILHIDTLKVFDTGGTVSSSSTGGLGSAGRGQLIGLAAILHGFSRGCTKCEVLAIDDAPQQHRRLVRHFQRMGLIKVRYVGDDLWSVPDRLVWGGCGTLMEAKLQDLVEKWTPVYRQ